MKRFFSTLLIASLVMGAMFLASCEIVIPGLPGMGDPMVPVHVCEFVPEVIEPTCTQKGYTLHHCEGCGYTYRDSFVDPVASNHKEFVEVLRVEATCTENGYILYACADCGAEKTQANGKAGHDISAWEVVKAPACSEYGIERRYCKNCDECYEERDIAPAHAWDAGVVTAPDCVTDGYITYTCTVEGCGEVNVEYANSKNKLYATGHNYEKDKNGDPVWVVIENATCEKEGIKHNYCTNSGCDAYHTAVIEKHTYETIVVDPTCTEYGKVYEQCTQCGDNHLITHTSPIGHKYDVWTDVEGCPGIEESKCEHCGEVLQRTKEQ